MTTNSPEKQDVRELPGLIATVVTTGSVTPEYANSLAELRSWNDRNGFHKIEYLTFDAKLVEAGRDNAVRHALKNNYAWLLQIDADAYGFGGDSLQRLFQTAYITHPNVDAVGAYCQLKGDIPLPTIDTGTGTWEEWYPNNGIIDVIRTGAHFLFVKCDAFRRMSPTGEGPWFRTRRPMRPVDAMFEVDNFARTQLDGRNPFWGHDWEMLLSSAATKSPLPNEANSHVGEDSGFCDNMRALGGRIVVDTHIWAGHVGKKYYTPDDLRDGLRKRERQIKNACGLLDD